MPRRRFYAPPAAFAADSLVVTLNAEETRHLHDVLRLGRGDEVAVFDGTGREFQCRIETVRKDSALLQVLTQVTAPSPESPLDLTLAVALLKGEKFDLVIQKSTELGVCRIIPLMTDRADVRLRAGDDVRHKVSRWQRIALEAAKQSGRAAIPEIAAPLAFASFAQLVSKLDEGRDQNISVLMFSERGGQSLAEAINVSNKPRRLIAVVGPEGGWADEEIELARSEGWSIITLGGRTLRAETAAIAIVTLLEHRFGDVA